MAFGCSGDEKKFDNPVLQDLDGDGLGYFEDCDDTNASIGQPEGGCAAGGICTDDTKCVSGVCDLSNPDVRGDQTFGRCLAPACDDGLKNGDETDVDCGGACAACARGKLCAANADCESRLCLEGRCSEVECGDGVVSASEECDDGNRVNEDVCTNDCETARCGDGVRRTDVAEGEAGHEECDDGNVINVDSCLNTCVSARCGDGTVGPGEECDDGNAVDTDGCRNTCRVADDDDDSGGDAIGLPMPAGETHIIGGWLNTPAFVTVGNLDGDDTLDFINRSAATETESMTIEARKLDGTLLWVFDTNGLLNTHLADATFPDHEPCIAWDMDGDGIDEVLTVQFRGSITSGEVYFVVLDGPTGAIKGEIRQPTVIDSLNESRRYATIAYLDGPDAPPSFCVSHGVYGTEAYVWAFSWDDLAPDKLSLKWTYDHQASYNNKSTSAHELGSFDVNDDGREEVIFGGTCINHDGTPRWSLLDHGDYYHVDFVQYADINPTNPGWEVYYAIETPHVEEDCDTGTILVDADTGAMLWRFPGNDVEDGWCADADASIAGWESRARSAPDATPDCDSIDVFLHADGQELPINPDEVIYRNKQLEIATIEQAEPLLWSRPVDFSGGDRYDLWRWNSPYDWTGDLSRAADNHGAEEVVMIDRVNNLVTVRFNMNASARASRWNNRHYRQDLARLTVGHARWHTIAVEQ